MKAHDAPVIKPFMVEGEFYVYDTYKNKILRLPSQLITEIQTVCRLGISEYLNLQDTRAGHKCIVQLIDKGYLQPPQIDSIAYSQIDKVVTVANRCTRHMILQVTKNCNFKCRYCAYAYSDFGRNHTDLDMEWDTAKKAMDFLFIHSMDAPKVMLSFYGGEPMLKYELIKKCVEYSKNLFINKPILYSTTCNGSILTEEHIGFLEKHNFTLLLSLDGPEAIQNKHRKIARTGEGSYDIVIRNIKNLIDHHYDYFEHFVSFNPVMLEEDELPVIEDFFLNELHVGEEKFSPSIANLSGNDYYTHMAPKKDYNKYFKQGIFESYNKAFESTGNISSSFCHGGFCVPGYAKVMVNTDGDLYLCEKVNELNDVYKLGNINTGYDSNAILRLFDIINLTENECKKCWQIRFCQICAMECGKVDGYGFSAEQKTNKCVNQGNILLTFLKQIVSSGSDTK